MTAVVMINSEQNASVDTIEDMYTSPTGTRITSFVAANSGEASASFKAYLYDSTGTELPPVIPMTIVVKDRVNLGAPLIGQLIPPGGSLRIESSGPLTFRATGDAL
jgi:hypothetical protein